MKMVMEYNDQFGMVCIEAEGIEMRVIESEQGWNRYFVTSSSGIRKSFDGIWDFERTVNVSDTEIFLFNTAYAFLELKRTRLEKQTAEIGPDLEGIVE